MTMERTMERQFFTALSIEPLVKPRTADAEQMGHCDAIQQLLVYRGTPAALRYCVENSIWDIAFLLAHSVSEVEFAKVAQLFVLRTFSNDTILSGALSQRGTSANWQYVLANSVVNSSAHSNVVLERTVRSMANSDDRQPIPVILPFVKKRQQAGPRPPQSQPPVPLTPLSPRPAPPPPRQPRTSLLLPPPPPAPDPPARTDAQPAEQKESWIERVLEWMNPFHRKDDSKSISVDLSEHDSGEIIWDGARYVVKGREEDSPTQPPPPPPPARARVPDPPPIRRDTSPSQAPPPSHSPPAPGDRPASPPPAGQRARSRRTGKYPNLF
jgi:hypothetical protein